MRQETLETKPDASMVTAEGRSNLVIVATTLVKLHRAGKLSDDDFLVASELGKDWDRIRRPAGGGGNLERVGDEEFVLMPGSRSGVQSASNERAGACKRIADARIATGHVPDFMLALTILQGETTLEQIDESQHRRNGTASKTFCGAIKRINAARIYETRRYRSQIMAAA